MSKAKWKRGGQFQTPYSLITHILEGGYVYLGAHPTARPLSPGWTQNMSLWTLSCYAKRGHAWAAVPRKDDR